MRGWGLIALLWAGCPLFAQSGPPSPSVKETIHARSTLVLVPTLVRTTSGELVTGLHLSDFSVTDNGVEQKVSLETVERQPVAILVLMQTGGAAPRQFDNYRTLTPMLDYLAGDSHHEASVITFDSQPEDVWSPFTSHTEDLKDAFVHPVAGDRGAAVLDAVDYGIGVLSKEPPGMRRIILLLSQPQDDGSKAKPEDVVRNLGENNITIFSVSFSPEKTWLKDQFTKPRQENAPYQMSPDHPPILHTFNLSAPLAVALKAMREDAAAEIATLSGGEHARFDDRRSLDQQLAMLANHIPNRYLLSFQPSSNDSGFHAIGVRVLGQSVPLAISAREGYWAAAPETSK